MSDKDIEETANGIFKELLDAIIFKGVKTASLEIERQEGMWVFEVIFWYRITLDLDKLSNPVVFKKKEYIIDEDFSSKIGVKALLTNRLFKMLDVILEKVNETENVKTN